MLYHIVFIDFCKYKKRGSLYHEKKNNSKIQKKEPASSSGIKYEPSVCVCVCLGKYKEQE